MKPPLFFKLLVVKTSLSRLRLSLFMLRTFHSSMDNVQLATSLSDIAEAVDVIYKTTASLLEDVENNNP